MGFLCECTHLVPAKFYEKSPKEKRARRKIFWFFLIFFLGFGVNTTTSFLLHCWGYTVDFRVYALMSCALVLQLSILWFDVGRDATGGPKAYWSACQLANNGMELRIIWSKVDSSAYETPLPFMEGMEYPCMWTWWNGSAHRQGEYIEVDYVMIT